jgi:hypothetical protein
MKEVKNLTSLVKVRTGTFFQVVDIGDLLCVLRNTKTFFSFLTNKVIFLQLHNQL